MTFMQANLFGKYCLLLVFIILVAMAASATAPVLAETSSADAAIASAKSKLIESFNDAKAAEAAGANITDLTDKLNIAGLLLSEAEQAYSSGNFYSAQSLATQSQIELSSLFSASNSLQVRAIQKQSLDLWMSLVGSICGTIAVLAGSIVTWIMLKHRYIEGK
jgi:hypothetical protein